jgi:dUTP pyrophosphatase
MFIQRLDLVRTLLIMPTSVSVINTQKCTPLATLPLKASAESAGSDLFSSADVIIGANERRLISTGVIADIPIGYFGLVVPRFSLALNFGVTTFGRIINTDDSEEIQVLLFNYGSDVLALNQL